MSSLRQDLAHELRKAAERVLSSRRRQLTALQARLAEVEASLHPLEREAAGLLRDRRALASDLSLARRPFSAELTVDEAWRKHPRAPEVFAAHGLPACDGCAVRFDETLAEAAEAYRLDLEELLRQLAALPRP